MEEIINKMAIAVVILSKSASFPFLPLWSAKVPPPNIPPPGLAFLVWNNTTAISTILMVICIHISQVGMVNFLLYFLYISLKLVILILSLSPLLAKEDESEDITRYSRGILPLEIP